VGRNILYGKLGRSMPLTLEKCGTLGGDIEMSAVLTLLANRYPDDRIILIGRNSGEDPRAIGLPANVYNPWHVFGDDVRRDLKQLGFKGNMTPTEQHRYGDVIDKYTLPYFHAADAIVMWVGQHGTSNHPLPKVEDRSVWTKPQDAFAHYAGFILRGINEWREINPLEREEIWLNADPRNYHKMRDLKWPLRHPILTQYNFTHAIKHERYEDTIPPGILGFEHYAKAVNGVWESTTSNVYSRLELNALVPGTPSGDLLSYNNSWEGREPFGLVINEARAIGLPQRKTRLQIMHDWVMPLNPHFIHGTWSNEAMGSLQGRWGIKKITSLPWHFYTATMHRVLSTFTTPSSGSGWATTKPWEAFGLGVVCFFHPDYDDQDNILRDAPRDLHEWLRPRTPGDLAKRVRHLSTPAGRSDWEALVALQYDHFRKNVDDPLFMSYINYRLEGSYS
jgi:hypothetical protein